MLSAAGSKELREFADKSWTEDKKRADEAGMNIIECLMQANDGLLRPVITKMLRHIKAHPDTCPPDCAWQESIKKLKKKFDTE